jgi:hypothetical protein
MFGNRDCRRESDQPQMRQQQGMPGKQMDRPQHLGSKFSPMLGKPTHQPAPLLAIFPKRSFGGAKIVLQHHRCTVVERMGQRRRRMDPFQAVVAQGQRREEWRSRSHRVHCGTEIVEESRQGERQGSRGAAGLRLRLEYIHLQACLGEDDGCRQTVGACADHSGSSWRRRHRR